MLKVLDADLVGVYLMDAGKLNKKITVLRAKPVPSEDGSSKVVFEPLKTTWAYVNSLYGKELEETKKYESRHIVIFIIRYLSCPDLKLSDRIEFNGVTYDIKHIDNPEFRNEYLKIKAVTRS